MRLLNTRGVAPGPPLPVPPSAPVPAMATATATATATAAAAGSAGRAHDALLALLPQARSYCTCFSII
jgi:hypothetical protein